MIINLLRRLFRKPQAAPSVPAPAPAAQEPIRAFDAYGREVHISREEWRTKVLPGALRSQRDNPDALYGTLVSALHDGFVADIRDAARHLHATDPVSGRGTCLYAIVLMELGRLDEAERLLRDHLARYRPEGHLLTNLAKVLHRSGKVAEAEQTLWQGIEHDPNQDNGLAWYVTLQKERGGQDAFDAAVARVAALPGSWRAQLWLAGDALKIGDTARAIELYHVSLDRAGVPAPEDLLMDISGTLGNHGRLETLLDLVEPRFRPELHGFSVGNNLIKAHLDLGHLDAASGILDALARQQRPDWRPHMEFWETELQKARIAVAEEHSAVPDELKSTLLTFEGPVWLKPTSPAAPLFQPPDPQSLIYCFLGGTAQVASNRRGLHVQMSDGPGRLSRALPLFLAEKTACHGQVQVRTLIQWLEAPHASFILSGQPWTEADAAQYARHSQPPADYVVVTHLVADVDPWVLELRLIRTIDAALLGALRQSCPPDAPQEAVPALARRLLDLLVDEAHLVRQPAPLPYQLPTGPAFADYLLRIEQLLAARCAGIEGASANFLGGVREIVQGNLHLCLAHPEHLPVRLLLAQTLAALRHARSPVPEEFRDKVDKLQREHPLPPEAQAAVTEILTEAFEKQKTPDN